MKKRLVCLLLAAVMLIGMLPMGFTEASAAANMSLSSNGLEFIKGVVGFEEEAYEWPEDSGKWYIGYHTPSVEGAVTTEAQASDALRSAVKSAKAESKVNSALSANVVQKRFDALVALTYLGGVNPAAMIDGVKFVDYVTTPGRSASDIANAICVRVDNCKDEDEVASRLAIANLFLNGVYNGEDSGNFGYTGFFARQGYFTTKGDNIRFQAYDTTVNNKIDIKDIATIKHEEPRNTFYGWFDGEDEDNIMITTLNASTNGMTLEAHWRREGGRVNCYYTMPALVLFVASETNPTGKLNVRASASDTAAVISTVASSEELVIVTQAEVGGNMWVELERGGWVKLGDVKKVPTLQEPEEITIEDDYVNLRVDPNPTSSKLGQLKRGDEVTIYLRSQVNPNWGYCEKGWLLLIYTDYFSPNRTHEDPDDGDRVIATAKVTSDTLNIRHNPSASSTNVGTLKLNQVVDIYEITTAAGHKWGRTAKGWICLTYTSVSNVTPSNNNSAASGGATGMIVNAPEVNVRKGPSTTTEKSGTVPMGTIVHIEDTADSSTATWALTEYGWICMDYIRMNSEIPYGKKATVNEGISLAVRSNAGTEYAKVTALPGGTVVEIETTKLVQGVQWGKIAQGWINMSFVTMANSGPVTTGVGATIVNCSTAANVRAAAGTSSQLVGTVAVGSRVYVSDRKLVKNDYWYQLEKGWVIDDYVKLDSEWIEPQKSDPIDPIIPTIFNGYPGVAQGEVSVYAVASSDANVVMTLHNGTAVNIRERKMNGKNQFGKVIMNTVTGWVNMDDILMSEVNAEVSAVKADVYEEPNVKSTFFESLKKGNRVTIKGDVSKAERGQVFDGSVLWGKLVMGGKTVWINMNDVNMYQDNQMPKGEYSKNGAGYLVGTTNLAETKTYKDKDGIPQLDQESAFTVVKGKRVDLTDRFVLTDAVGSFAAGDNFGRFMMDGVYYWIKLDAVSFSSVQMEVTDNTLKAYQSDLSTVVKNLNEEDTVTVLRRKLVVNGDLLTDWGEVYVNDDMSPKYWIILNEGKLEYITKQFSVPTERDVLTTVAVSARVKNVNDNYNIYEEVDASSKVLLKVKKGSILTVSNWKNDENGYTWCKIKVGDHIGWMMVDDLDFSELKGTVPTSTLNLYAKPDFASTVRVLNARGNKISFSEIIYTVDGALFGKTTVLGFTGWVNLAHVDLEVLKEETVTPVYTPAVLTGKINSVDQNVNVYPKGNLSDGTNPFALPKTTKVEITDIVTVANFANKGVTCVAAKLELGEEDGWIEFVKITPNAAVATVNSSKVEVFTDLEHNETFYTLYRGEKANVVSFKEYHNAVYGDALFGEVEIKGESGWILIADASGMHVDLTPGVTNNAVVPEAPSTPTVTPTTPVETGVAATIVGATSVNVRGDHETTAPLVGTLKNGENITVFEVVTSSLGVKWARIGAGRWVCMDYVQYGTGVASGVIAEPQILTTVPSGAIAVGYAKQDLDIYGGAGYGYGANGKVSKNASVVILENRLTGGVSWARIDKGWIILSYVQVTGIGTEGSGQMGNIARTGSGGTIRSQAGINGAELAKVMISSRVAILETTTYSGEAWGKTALGWINMQYVALASEMPTPPLVGTSDPRGDVG